MSPKIPTTPTLTLHDVEGMVQELKKSADTSWGSILQAYCGECGAFRRMDITVLKKPPTTVHGTRTSMAPSLWMYACRECARKNTVLIYDGPNGVSLAFLSSTYGGLGTPHTPAQVKYYLDQANRSEALTAHSAAVAMYRAAVEQLMYEQGYTKGMLNAKIVALESDIANGKSKPWARDLDPEFLKVLKDLGNHSIHPNGGDITKQDALDLDLVIHVRATMEHLLYIVYEEPVIKAERLKKLKSVTTP